MTRFLTARRRLAALLAATPLVLAGCLGGGGGSGGGGNAQLRVLNATVDLPSVDVYTDTDLRFSAVATDTLSDTVSLAAQSYTVKVTSAGNPTASFSGSYSLGSDKHYTGVIWGRNGSLKLATLPEDEDTTAISNGNSRVRIYNATSDAGSFDVYLTQGVDDLSNASPAVSGTAAGALTGYKDISTGTYRLRVTLAGDSTKVRLDVPAITLDEKQYATIVITPGSGGVLLNAGLLVQQGSYTPFKNNQARLRVVPGADGNAPVSVQIDGQTIAASLPSPPTVVAPYTTLPAGSHTVKVLINGTQVSSSTRNFEAGGDYTLLVYGSTSAGFAPLLADDNRLPASGRYKMRLVNAVSADPLTLTVDFSPIISDIPLGTASTYVTGVPLGSTSASQLTVSSLTASLPTINATLQSQGIYSVFVLGGNATPTEVLVKEP